MNKEKSFIVRLSAEDLNDFNEVLKKKAVNRSELLRQWIKQYIEEEKSGKK